MLTHKKIDRICIAAIVVSVLIAIMLMRVNRMDAAAVMSGEVNSDMFTEGDLDADWNTAFATKITLSESSSKIDGNGAYLNDGNVCIAYGGCYVLTGELSDGSVLIDVDKSDKIWLLLDGVMIHCEDDAAIRVEQADKVFLTLAEGTKNTLSSGAQYSEEASDAGVDGVIYSRDDLTINGSGALTVNAEYEHGIVGNDDLVIAGGEIEVNAPQDGIHANDSVRIRNAEISISAGDDGITVSNDDESAFLYVESGNITIPECYEGLEAADITIAGGVVDIISTDDGINANGSGENAVIRITGGDIRIVNPSGRDADGLDSNGDIYIEGGNIFISVADGGSNCAIDYGSENGGECAVSGGTVIACGGSAMAQGFDAGSTQGFLMYNTSAAAGTAVKLEDAQGRELLSEEIPCSFSSVVLSAPELSVGDVCKLTVGDVEEEITIDNVVASGFVPAGMFGGGMRGGKGRGGMSGFQGEAGGQDRKMPESGEFSGEMQMPDGGEFPGEMELPDGEEFPGRMEAPDEGEFPERMEAPDGGEFPGRIGAPDGGGFPDGMEAPDEGEFSERMEAADEGEFPGRMGAPDGENFPDRMRMQEASLSSSVPADTLALMGISVLVLLLGLFIAVKMKH